MRRIALLVAAAMLAPPASAQADVRYASPAGAGDCSQPNPCSLETAVSVALAGDEIVVASGLYALTAKLTPSVPLTIHGTQGQPRPSIVAPSGSAALDSTVPLAISDLTLASVDPGAFATLSLAGDNSTADRIEVIATSSAGPATALRPGNGVVVRDSLLRASSPTAAEALFYQATAPSTVTLRNVTAVASAPNSVALDIFATAAAPTASIEATNVIAAAGVDVSASHDPATTSAINLSHSNYDRVFVARGSTIGESGNQALFPQFVNAPGGDFRPQAGSPTIDAGLTDPANGALDLDGNTRTANGRTDIGAYEMQPVAIAVSPPRDTTAASTVIGALRLSRTGVVRATLTCPAGEGRCDWAYTLRSARSLVIAAKRSKRKRRKRVLQLGSGRASAPGARQVIVRIKLSKRNFRLIKRRKRLRVKLTVRTTDAAANAATTKRNTTLKPPKRKRK